MWMLPWSDCLRRAVRGPRCKKSFPIVEMGLHHEQQHQELILTDILHAFAQNPTHPVYDDKWQVPACQPNSTGFADVASGIHTDRP